MENNSHTKPTEEKKCKHGNLEKRCLSCYNDAMNSNFPHKQYMDWEDKLPLQTYDKVSGWATVDVEILKSFIKDTITKQKSEMIWRVEELRRQNKIAAPTDKIEEVDERAYDAACRDILDALKSI